LVRIVVATQTVREQDESANDECTRCAERVMQGGIYKVVHPDAEVAIGVVRSDELLERILADRVIYREIFAGLGQNDQRSGGDSAACVCERDDREDGHRSSVPNQQSTDCCDRAGNRSSCESLSFQSRNAIAVLLDAQKYKLAMV
jgi:hypothetical protein